MRIRTAIAVSGLLAFTASPSGAQNFVLYPATESGYDQTCNFVESGDGGICRVTVVLNLAPTQVLGARFGVIQEDINWTPLFVSSDFAANLGSFGDFQVGLILAGFNPGIRSRPATNASRATACRRRHPGL